MRDKVEFTFVDETGLCRKHYIGYDYTKAGSTGIPENIFDNICKKYLKNDGIVIYAR